MISCTVHTNIFYLDRDRDRCRRMFVWRNIIPCFIADGGVYVCDMFEASIEHLSSLTVIWLFGDKQMCP